MNRNILIIPAVLIASVFFSCGRSAEEVRRISREERMKQAKEERMALKIAVMPTLDCLPAFVARDCNLYDTAAVDIRLRKFSAQMDCDTALIGRSVEGAFSDFVRTERMKSHDGLQLDYLSSTNAYWNLVTSRKARVRKISQLDDKMIGMTRYSATDLLTTKFTEGIRLKSQVFRIQINDVNVRLAMLLNNEIDAVWLPEPQATEARMKGGNVIADSRDKKKVLGVLAFRAEVMKDSHRRKQLAVFEKAYNMACDSLNKNGLQHYSSVLKKHYGIDDKVINALPKIKYTHMKKPSKAETDNIVL